MRCCRRPCMQQSAHAPAQPAGPASSAQTLHPPCLTHGVAAAGSGLLGSSMPQAGRGATPDPDRQADHRGLDPGPGVHAQARGLGSCQGSCRRHPRSALLACGCTSIKAGRAGSGNRAGASRLVRSLIRVGACVVAEHWSGHGLHDVWPASLCCITLCTAIVLAMCQGTIAAAF